VTPNLWGAVVGPPAAKKSPAIAAGSRPLDRLIAEAKKAHRIDLEAFEYEKLVHDAKVEALKGEIKVTAKAGSGERPEVIAGRLKELAKQGPKEPTERRFKSNDTTIEKLGELLRDNPAGLLLQRDELVGLFASLERPGHEGARQFYLEGWNGIVAFNTDRIGRGSIHIPNLCITIFGGIQPDKLRTYLEIIERELGNDGLLRRFQLLVYPDPQVWEWRDRRPLPDAADRVFEVVKNLSDFDPLQWGAEAPSSGSTIPAFRFAEAAQSIFVAWLTELHRERLPAIDHPLVAQHLTKYEKLFPGLALILHLVECAASGERGPVSESAALRAAGWCEYLEAHARRCYGLLMDNGAHAARVLADRIAAGKLPDNFTARDVSRAHWSGLTDEAAIQKALEWLQEDHWIRNVDAAVRSKGGRPTTRYVIHPDLPRAKDGGDYD
jgi:Protein of unknown function (DUF3987)